MASRHHREPLLAFVGLFFIVAQLFYDLPRWEKDLPTIALQCAASNHDCLVYKDILGNWQLNLTHNEDAVGFHGLTRKAQGCGLYFPDVPIPEGSKIHQAFLLLRSNDFWPTTFCRSLIRAEENATPLVFTTLADYQARSKWIVVQFWDFIYKKWHKDELYASPDIGKFVQHVIDLPAWAEGNPIVFFWDDHDERSHDIGGMERTAYSYDDKPEEAPRLEITYQPPVPPPAPPPALLPTPPTPPRKGWAGLDLQYEYLEDGFKLILHTDTPCHLWCRMTTTPPRKHSLPSMRRGLRISGDIRFCFVVYEDNEQAEAGDTLVHTFTKVAWPVCETRWFYFVGTVYGDPSPTETAIFEFHYPTKPPPPVYTSIILEVTADGYMTGIRDEWLHEPPTHWDKVRTEDCIFDPYKFAFGFHEPNYVFERYLYNDDFYRDFYILENPPMFFQPITKLTLHGKLGRNLYPYGKYKFSVRTHSTNYTAPEANLQPGLEWESHDYLVNPFTGNAWTRQEVKDMEIGIWLGKEAAFGRAVCDKLYLELVLS